MKVRVAEEEEEEEEEEGLFKADAVNEEDPERDRATREPRSKKRRPPSLRPPLRGESMTHAKEGGGWCMCPPGVLRIQIAELSG